MAYYDPYYLFHMAGRVWRVNPDQRLWPFQTRQVHAVEMQPGRHEQVSCSPPAFSPSYQGLCMCVVLHRLEAFVSSCRTSLSLGVTCVAIGPVSTSQTGEFTAMRPGLLHAATKQLVPGGQISNVDRTHWTPSRGRACPFSCVFPRTGTCCFKLITQHFRRTSSRRGFLRCCSHRTPSTCFTFRAVCRSLCTSSLSSSGEPNSGLRIAMVLNRD